MFNKDKLSTKSRSAAIYHDIIPYIEIRPENVEMVLMLIEGNICIETEQRYAKEKDIHLEYAKQFEEMAAVAEAALEKQKGRALN